MYAFPSWMKWIPDWWVKGLTTTPLANAKMNKINNVDNVAVALFRSRSDRRTTLGVGVGSDDTVSSVLVDSIGKGDSFVIGLFSIPDWVFKETTRTRPSAPG